jgi:hypothetical protein
MDITDVDLNLLVVFDALLKNRSVSAAARALKMSQPATSFGCSSRPSIRPPSSAR